MAWARSRYGLPVILYNWIIGIIGIALLFYCTFNPPATQNTTHLNALMLFFAMHIIASFLHFQYARLNIVITFEAAFTTATLLVFGTLPAAWISAAGIIIGSVKRVVERRWILHRNNPLSYDLGIIFFNTGMISMMWIIASWVYGSVFNGEIPLKTVDFVNLFAILAMFLVLSILNHIILLTGSYLQGLDPMVFLRKGVLPAFLTEFATFPFGIVMALAFTRMGTFAFFFLGTTLLLSNAVLRNLSLIRYDLEEKIRQLTGLNTISKQVIGLRDEESVIKLLFSELGTVLETGTLFLAQADEHGNQLRFIRHEIEKNPSLAQICKHVAANREIMFIENARKEAPEETKEILRQEGIRSLIALPLQAGNKLYGVMGVFSREASAFKPEHMKVLATVADQSALALENSRLYSALTDQVDELERLNKELRQLDRLKSEFLANVSHELRTPLTSIKGYVEYIRKEKLGPITPLQNEGLTVANRNIVRLQRLINDLLDYTRLEFKKAPLTLTPVSMEKLWNEVYDEHAEIIAKRKLSIHVSISPDLPMLLVDQQRIGQVLSNLLSNAIKFTPDGGDISLDVHTIGTQNSYFNSNFYRNFCMIDVLLPVQIKIRDTGIGIPPEALPKIFDRFYQADSSNTRKYGGTGIGLAIVKSVLDAHGVTVNVNSKVGEGTEISFVVAGIHQQNLQAIKHGPMDAENRPKYLI